SRLSGVWDDDDFDVYGAIVGRIMKATAAPVGQPWLWSLAYGHHEDRTPIYGYEPTREAAMAFAKSWRRGCKACDCGTCRKEPLVRILMMGAILAGTGMIVAILLLSPAGAEEVCVKYHKCLDIDQFKCETITRSSFINRVCYLEAKRYMIIKLKDTY